jgi:hypothetical protein
MIHFVFIVFIDTADRRHVHTPACVGLVEVVVLAALLRGRNCGLGSADGQQNGAYYPVYPKAAAMWLRRRKANALAA